MLKSTRHCILSINATFLKVLCKWSRVASLLIISIIILTTSVKMKHFDLLPLLELNFNFESFESLKKVRLFANELDKTITGIIINKCDEIFVAIHSKRSEWPINICMNNPKQLDVLHPKLYPDSFITCLGYNKSKSIFFWNKIRLKIKFRKLGICTRYKGKSEICQNRI